MKISDKYGDGKENNDVAKICEYLNYKMNYTCLLVNQVMITYNNVYNIKNH